MYISSGFWNSSVNYLATSLLRAVAMHCYGDYTLLCISNQLTHGIIN